MTDVLGQRLRALADATHDSDWLDVRRRARPRPRRPLLLAAAAALAATVAAASLAAGSGWLFRSHDRQVTAETQLTLHGRTWTVSLTSRSGNWLSRFCVRVEQKGGAAISGGCGRATSRLVGPPFGARHFDVDGGQIWVGATLGYVRSVAITDARGHVHRTRATAPPRGTRTPFRYWALALDAPARSITARLANGRALTRRL
jgi:hypothetical protein